MNLLASIAVYTGLVASEVISPVPEKLPALYEVFSKPTQSFSEIITLTKPITVKKPTHYLPPVRKSLKKNSYTIVAIGDSMVDTLGKSMPELSSELKRNYPETNFQIHNYGIGSTNLQDALKRINQGMTKENSVYPPVVELNPDLVIIESCAYNQVWTGPESLDEHWLTLAKAVDLVNQNLPQAKLALMATIAPNSAVFGDGAPEISFSRNEKLIRTTKIRAFLENTLKFAESQAIPVIDAYSPSLETEGDGKLLYINSGDHIHYSLQGKLFTVQKITQLLVNNRILN
jgi:disulfide oxidoreductase YuzD